ncbi:MAG: hypothetical protein RMI91_14095 [Gemmatales bacterium]|nr:hypothetical protein [Gemmatales bacterium]MDW7995777.1 hypothetical protein [Gemmatales bacterium]
MCQALRGMEHVVEWHTDEEALPLLARASGLALEGLPRATEAVLVACGQLP